MKLVNSKGRGLWRFCSFEAAMFFIGKSEFPVTVNCELK